MNLSTEKWAAIRNLNDRLHEVAERMSAKGYKLYIKLSILLDRVELYVSVDKAGFTMDGFFTDDIFRVGSPERLKKYLEDAEALPEDTIQAEKRRLLARLAEIEATEAKGGESRG